MRKELAAGLVLVILCALAAGAAQAITFGEPDMVATRTSARSCRLEPGQPGTRPVLHWHARQSRRCSLPPPTACLDGTGTSSG